MKQKLIISLLLCLCLGVTGCAATSPDHASDAAASQSTEITYPQSSEVKLPEVFVSKMDFSESHMVSDSNFQFTVAGIQQYDKLENEVYTDTPEEGKVYLVLFLNIINFREQYNYINPNYVYAKVDGSEEITNSAIYNEPVGRKTIFHDVDPGESLDGFIVWQVPKDWKTLDVTFDNWKELTGQSIQLTITPDDLFEPEELLPIVGEEEGHSH